MLEGNTTLRLIILIVYLSFIVGFGIRQGLKAKSSTDYNMGGRNIPGWVAALSERATGESAWCLVGFPGFAYASGLVTVWTAVGLALGNIIAWSAIANKMRREAAEFDAQTYVDWVAKRHGNSKAAHAARLVGAFIIIFMFTFYVEAQLLGGGKTLNVMFGLNPTVGILLTMCVIIPYTVIGGFQSVVYTDCVQSIIMIFTLIVTPIVGIFYIANAPDGAVFAHSIGEALANAGPEYKGMAYGLKGIAAGFAIASEFAWIIAYLGGCPHLTVRFMSIRDEKQWKLGRNIAISWTVCGYAGAVLVGLVGLAIFGPNALADAEMVMPSVALTVLPSFIGIICVVGAIAAMISTADSMLIVTSSEFCENILKPSMRKRGRELSIKDELRISRMVTVVVGLLATALPFIIPANMVNAIVSFAWAGMGNPFAVTTLCTLFWKKYTGKAALWTMICGFLGTVLWQISPMNSFVNARLVGVIPAILAAVIVTNLTQNSDKEDPAETEAA